MADPTKAPIDAMSEAMSDPDMQSEVQNWIAKYAPALSQFEQRMNDGDQDVIQAVREIACNACNLVAMLEEKFDPALASILLNATAAKMAEQAHHWDKYTTETAPRVIERRARAREASDG